MTVFLQLKKQYGMYSGEEFQRLLAKLPATEEIVKDLIPPASVNILVGDSGLGKTPLVYQLGLAVAAGTAFLGLPVRQAKVVIVDYENAPWETFRIMEQQRKLFGLAAYPFTFLVWPAHLDPPENGIEPIIRQLAPDFVIIDSLRSFNPGMEADNRAATRQIKQLRKIANRHGTALLLVHHIRKSSRRSRDAGSLESEPAIDWLMRSAGARALINQTDVRPPWLATTGASSCADTTVRNGEVGPFLLRRVWDADGEPAGYERLTATPGCWRIPRRKRFPWLAENTKSVLSPRRPD